MTSYTDRSGQRIGPWTVEADHGRTKRGRVLWRLRHEDGRLKVLRTERVIRLARAYDVPAPTTTTTTTTTTDTATATDPIGVTP